LPDRPDIRINESYRDYQPPFDAQNVVRKLLEPIPDKYLRGLDCIVLTSESSLSRKDRVGKVWARKRKFDKSQVRGRYHSAWQGRLPWIEIRVDKTIEGWGKAPSWLWHLPILPSLCIGEVLYHELGHHIHDCVHPEYREKEDVADNWRKKLMANLFRKKYWYLLPIVIPMGKAYRFAKRRRHNRSSTNA